MDRQVFDMFLKIQQRVTDKFVLISQAFRFFDQRLKNKLSKQDFNQGLLLFKMVLEDDELSKIFNFFDQDCDGFISLHEFGVIYSDDGDIPVL